MYFYLACFWFLFGVALRFFWHDLEPHLRGRGITVDVNIILFVCFVLVCYNMIRWRMRQALENANEWPERRRRREQAVDPTFDFSDPKPEDREKKPPL